MNTQRALMQSDGGHNATAVRCYHEVALQVV
eukprot:COSAG01_NODE_37400_length_504_cov_0.639506_1_plen_30_part_10